jgi:predicted Zn-dependent protease
MASKNRLEQIEEMLRNEPDDPELLYMLAMEHSSGGNDVEAVRCFDNLIARCPNYPPGFHQGARAMLRLGRVNEAKAALQKGIPAALAQSNEHAAGEMQELLASLD